MYRLIFILSSEILISSPLLRNYIYPFTIYILYLYLADISVVNFRICKLVPVTDKAIHMKLEMQ